MAAFLSVINMLPAIALSQQLPLRRTLADALNEFMFSKQVTDETSLNNIGWLVPKESLALWDDHAQSKAPAKYHALAGALCR